MDTKEQRIRASLKDKKRIVVKIGSSSLMHPQSGALNLGKIERLVRQLTDLNNEGKDVVLVSSGAIAVGRKALNMKKNPERVCAKQACASVGQAQLMMNYQKLFSEYNQPTGQILMTKYTILNPVARENAHNTFDELFRMGIIPIVNENDTISTYEIHFGDNDTLSALVASLTNADLLIMLSDINGFYTDNPRVDTDAQLIPFVEKMDDKLKEMAKPQIGSSVGTGGMKTKLTAASIAIRSGVDVVLANAADFGIIGDILSGMRVGTVFAADRDPSFDIVEYLKETAEEKYAADAGLI